MVEVSLHGYASKGDDSQVIPGDCNSLPRSSKESLKRENICKVFSLLNRASQLLELIRVLSVIAKMLLDLVLHLAPLTMWPVLLQLH
jgi:hypothetical protein